MKRVLVYDWPTRIFHWMFAALFIGAFAIAKTVDDDSWVYPIHMLFGMTLMLLVILRVVWGLVGTRYALFSSFSLNPRSLVRYFQSLVSSKTEASLGHNPASSWAALFMIACVPVLASTGYLMVQGVNKDFFEEIHELTATLFAITALAHVIGVIFHSIRHRDQIALSMISGTKAPISGQRGIANSQAFVGAILVLIIGLFGFYLKQNYDVQNRSLQLFGLQLQLGDNEKEDGDKNSESQEPNSSEKENDQDGDD